jgi:hypothetical protein
MVFQAGSVAGSLNAMSVTGLCAVAAGPISTDRHSFVVVCRIFESVTPLIRAQVERLVTPKTAHRLIRDQVGKTIQKNIAAVGTLDRNTDTLKKRR